MNVRSQIAVSLFKERDISKSDFELPQNGTYTSIYRKSADGSGSTEQLFRWTPGAGLNLTDVSADGKYITFSSGGAVFVVALTDAIRWP